MRGVQGMTAHSTITRLLVANRGEIARRIFRTCRELGIETVAVFSDADEGAPHMIEADLAVRLGAPLAYLDVEALVDAARRSGADAVHPGYGFLSENAAFAQAVIDAGLTWVGPPPGAIAAMGSKIEAKRLMAEAGVPVLPTLPVEPDVPVPPSPTGEKAQAHESAAEEATARQDAGWRFPLLVKASMGGGGRGMRVVRTPAELGPAVAAASREAEAAFGDGTVFVEPLLDGARHIEVQVLADAHGTVWALGERECSIQRRHQKVVEECPSPAATPELRERLEAAAVAAAEKIGYVGAGTVEFLVKDDTIAFLEMNTRLQVEHPVTELVYGVDLVELQLRVAEGEPLPAQRPAPSGHAVEVRLYAEDGDHLPQSGVVELFEVPGPVRVDSGVESGSVVSTHYDPMLAKIIAYGGSRTAAIRKLTAALDRARVHGLATNRRLLRNILAHPAFAAGDTHTSFLDEHDLAARAVPTGLEALAAALAIAARAKDAAVVQRSLPSGWRNVRSQPQVARFEEIEVCYDPVPDEVTVVGATPYQVVVEVGGVRRAFAVAHHGGRVYVGDTRLIPLPRLPEPAEHHAPGSLLAPMPGSVLRVEVEQGDAVVKGQVVLVLEAMKMEHQIAAPADGVVAAVMVEKGSQVEAEAVLAIIEEGEA
ncbi:acetyl/propionyl/methylcrotonyl-CoA carboxylase subunit alpha [Nonomuraea sp. NPDC059194]|uniref:acetyl/propionyl/methylcrotonyl-CoA carboxylase subunit alpha n=1 Tax=Nonomuraea sp. NPDC059194 TaxID=3346764 RepID=UPI0036CD05BA